MASARAPQTSAKGLVHGGRRSAAPLAGLVAWPAATAPAQAPRRKGVMALAIPKIRPHLWRAGPPAECALKAKAAPRMTMPKRTREKGRNRPTARAEKAV